MVCAPFLYHMDQERSEGISENRERLFQVFVYVIVGMYLSVEAIILL
jgi:hypothetical protein